MPLNPDQLRWELEHERQEARLASAAFEQGYRDEDKRQADGGHAGQDGDVLPPAPGPLAA